MKELGAHTVVNHSSDNFEEEIRRAAPAGVDYVFSTTRPGFFPLLARVMNPFGQIVAIDSAPEDDFQVLKPKALTWHWENVFARAVHGALDITNQHRVLDAVADLVEARKIRPTMTQVFQGVTVAIFGRLTGASSLATQRARSSSFATMCQKADCSRVASK